MNLDPAAAYPGNPLCARIPVTLPEPIVTRAQSVTRTMVARWLQGVIDKERDGYAVIAGNSRTVIVLYGDGRPLSAAVTRGPQVESPAEALATIRKPGKSDFFVMTYKLAPAAAVALSGLFVRPSVRELIDDPAAHLKELLADGLPSHFVGAVLLRADFAWAVLLVNDGALIGCYGSDDHQLKTSIDDATALFYFDEVEMSIHPAVWDSDLDAVLSGTSAPTVEDVDGSDGHHTELEMIELLSELENSITRAEAAEVGRAETLVRGLVRAYDRATELSSSGEDRHVAAAPGHPLLETHWDPITGRLETGQLIETLHMAGIQEAWLAASDALCQAVELAVEQQLAWLSVADEASSSALQEALADLLLQARELIRRMRVSSRQHAASTAGSAQGLDGFLVGSS